jgi:hypothetical protein
MNNVHEDHPVVFESRWALSYLRGPLTRDQISALMASRKQASVAAPGSSAATKLPAVGVAPADARPILPPGIEERFLPRRARLPAGATLLYRPAVLGQARVHFSSTTNDTDVWQNCCLQADAAEDLPPDCWGDALEVEGDQPELETQPEASAQFASLPAELMRAKRYSDLSTALKDYLYRNRKLSLWKSPDLKQTSTAEESQADFRVRLAQAAREQRDLLVEKLRQKYSPKLATLTEQIRKAAARVDKEKSQATQQTLSAALAIGSSILGAMFGRKLASSANITRAASGMRAAGRIARERQDVGQASETVEALQEKLAALEAEFKTETDQLQASMQVDSLQLEELQIKPKKSDITISQIALVWVPWIQQADGTLAPAAS